MAINLYIRLMTTEEDVERLTQHYKETYRFRATGDDADADIQNYRLRHFLTVNAPNSTVTPNTGLMVYDGTGMNNLTGSYNDWTTPNRPPKFDNSNSQFNTELIMRFDVAGRRFRDLANNLEAWLTVPYANDNGVFTPLEISHAFSFLGYPNNNENVYVKNPMNLVLEHKVAGGEVSVIETLVDSMPSGRLPGCTENGDLYQVQTVRVETATAHGLKVGDAVTLYSRSVSHVPSYTGSQGRLFGLYNVVEGKWKGRGERYLGDFVVTSVPTSTSFTYKTYHNPMKINRGNYPNGQRYTHNDWNDLVWEKWELYEYHEDVEATARGTSVTITFQGSDDPSGVTCKHNFALDDKIAYIYDNSTKVHLKVTAVAQDGRNIVAEVSSGESIQQGITSGTLVYTPRMPSSDVAYNVAHDDIAPVEAASHSSESAIFYACQDTYYDQTSSSAACYGTSDPDGNAQLWLAYNQKIPIIKFPIPFYNGAATIDNDMVARLFVYCNKVGGSPNSVDVFDFTDNWNEAMTNGDIARIHSGSWADDVVGHMAKFDVTSPTRTTAYRYLEFDISPEFVANMFTDPSHTKSVYLNIQSDVPGSGNHLLLASREDDEAHWPYIAIRSPVFIGKNPEIELDNTYMYLVCDEINLYTDGDIPTFVATVSPKLFDSTNLMYVRSWNDDDKPFFVAHNQIEIMNTEHYNTVRATVSDVDYAAHKVYFTYQDSADKDKALLGNGECGIIRNKSRMISTYSATDADNVPSNLSVTGPQWYGKFGYEGESLEFDVIHDEAQDNSTSLSAVYSDGNVASNTETPVIITDLTVVEGIHDRPVDRYMHVGPDNAVILKGFNLNLLSSNATAVLGHIRWEDGIGEGTSVRLDSVDGHPDERRFEYNDDFDLQRVMPVYDVRNDSNDGATEFKILQSDAKYPYLVKGDVFAPIFTGAGRDIPRTHLKYGVNYYIGDEPVVDGDYVWIKLTSSYTALPWIDPDTADDYVSLSDDEVSYIHGIIPSNPSSDGEWPILLYSTVTSVMVKDSGVDTLPYANRLYLQIDEEAPVYYMEEETHLAGVPFDVYISDLNEIYVINGYTLKDYPDGNNFPLGKLERLLGENDDRFIKLTLNLLRSTTIELYDAAGNYTSFPLTVKNTIFNLDITGISSSGTTHTLNFTVQDTEASLLSTAITNIAGNTGIYASFGTIQNISSISEGDDGMYYFTFDLVLTEDVLSQSDGKLEVWAGDTNTGDSHQKDDWCSPIIFQKNFTCVETGSVLQYRGVNLYETDTKKLELRGPNPSSFSIDSIDSTTTISIKVLATQTGNRSFAIHWKNENVPPAISNYVNTVTVTSGPKITIPAESQTVKLKKGTAWTEPDPWDVVATDYMGNVLPASSIEISVDNNNWDEFGTHTITYTVVDSCGRHDSVDRYVKVIECDIPIILTKDVYDMYEDIGIMIAPESTVLFNQHFMNNVVEYRFNDSEEWTPAIILSGTPDRKMLTIKNPGVLASGLLLRVNVGEDNNTANGCFTTEPVDFSIISKEDQDKPLNVDGKASIVKKNSSRSRFDDLNFEPVYNKDLSYSSFSITADENSLMQNVYSILLTNLGERLYDDEFGSTLEESVFEIIGDLNGESKLLNQCVTLINKYEPRAVVVEDKSYVAINEDNTVVIVLYIKVPRGVARKIELTFRKST